MFPGGNGSRLSYKFAVMISVVSTAAVVHREWVVERLRVTTLPPFDPGEVPLFRHPADKQPIPAAVLVPLVNRPEGTTILLTQRTAHLNKHAGQISFPGGRVDPDDLDRIDTALRETAEEIGLPRDRVETLGVLPDFDIATGFRVTPVVGWVEPPFDLAPDPFEVADIFEVPLHFLLDRANYQRHEDVRDGRRRHYYAVPYETRHIWGATAGMLYCLRHLLAHDH